MKNYQFLHLTFFIFSILIIACGGPVVSQNLTELTVQPFWESQNKVTYQLQYEIEGEGENAMGKSILKNQFTVEKIDEVKDIMTIKILAEKTECSNPDLLEDGEGSMMFAMLGLNIIAKVNKDGSFIKIENEEEVINEFKAGLTGFSDDHKDRMVEQMLNENRGLFFSKMFELNCASLFKHVNKTVEIPSITESDSLVVETVENPKTTVKTTETVKYNSKLIEMTTKVIGLTDEFSQDSGDMVYVSKPSSSEMNEVVLFDDQGLLQSITTEVIQKMNGFEVVSEGKVINSSAPFTQKMKTTIELIE